MAATNVATLNLVGPYPTLPLGAGALTLTGTAMDAVNGNDFIATGRQLLLITNTGASTRTVTFTSQPDDLGRTGDVTAYSIAAGVTVGFWFGALKGWADAGSKITVTGAHAELVMRAINISE